MHRPARTRRLSIAALVCCALFVVAAGAGVRSFWKQDSWIYGTDKRVVGFGSGRGRIVGLYISAPADIKISHGHQSWDATSFEFPSPMLPVAVVRQTDHLLLVGDLIQRAVWVPLWFPLLLLLIAPARWLIARPANAPAFPVIAETRQK